MGANFFKGLERISNQISINIRQHVKSKFSYNKEYVLVWYGRLFIGFGSQNDKRLIEVVFLTLDDDDEVRVKLPIELAPKLTIGSIWLNYRTQQKYDFDDQIAVIEKSSGNLSYSNHFGISKKEKGVYEFDVTKYPVKGLKTDTNTLLVILQNNQKVIIHPLIFFMAHYGASKEINRILVTELWADIEKELNLNYPDPNTSEVVLIPDSCAVGDAVFLHHLKTDDYTKMVVKGLNSRVRQSLRDTESRSAPLKVQPYHQQPVLIAFKSIELESNVFLCTEITGISMPQGEDIVYAFKGGNEAQDASRLATRTYRPLFNKVDTEEVVIEASNNAGNSTTAVIRQKIATIGDIRNLVKTENITIDEALQTKNSQVIPLREPIPESYAVGDRRSSDNTVGILKSLICSNIVPYQKPSFKKLLQYAKDLRLKAKYSNLQIDSYSEGRFHGETTGYLNSYDGSSNVLNIFVLRLKNDDETYYFFDCSVASGIKTSGNALRVDDNEDFINNGMDNVLERLFNNNGRLDHDDELRRLYGPMVTFNHTTGSSDVNWVTTALTKLNNSNTKM